MSVHLANVGKETAPRTITWSRQECALYALAVGADFSDLPYVLDEGNEDFRVLPTFPLALLSAHAARSEDSMLGAGDFEGHVQVLAGQALELYSPLPTSGSISVTGRLEAIYDKTNAASVVLASTARRSDTGELLFTAQTTMFILGAGGFGGARGPQQARIEMPQRAPDMQQVLVTSPIQSLLYRHASGDTHGIHADPRVATAAGFAGPILGGQNTLGIAAHAIVRAAADGHGDRVRAISGRFTAPALNSDMLTTEMWRLPPEPGSQNELIHFRVVNQRNEVVIQAGECRLGPANEAR